ncbi:hypothetical protein L6R50_12095 [Myxococcota bacterium]|nr:hypothetical protein [Myxococcota bacterium]
MGSLPRGVAVAGLLLALASPGAARASACCVGATSATPGVLGRCERFGFGGGYSFERTLGEFRADGDFTPAGESARTTHRFVVAGRYRPTRFLQVGADLPLLVQSAPGAEGRDVGGGVGDVSVFVRVDPVEDAFAARLPRGVPVPVFSLAVAFPSGKGWQDVDSSSPGSVTGTGRVVLTPTLTLERTGVRGGIALAGSVSLGLPRPDEGDGAVLPGAAWRGAVTGQVFATRRLTFAATAGARGSAAATRDGEAFGVPGVEPLLGIGASASLSRSMRLAAGVEGGLPIAGLGRAHGVQVAASVTLMGVLTPPDRNFRPRAGPAAGAHPGEGIPSGAGTD